MVTDLASIKEIPVVLLLPDKENKLVRYRLVEEMTILGVKIHKDFVTDGASTPRFLWGVYPPVDKYFLAAVLHDFLLKDQQGWTKANEMFNQALVLCDVIPTRRRAMHAGTVVYGYMRTHFFDDIL